MKIRLAIALVAMMVSGLSMSAFGAFGRTQGQFAVSQMGSAQYSIPIWTPPGIHGIQPNLALTYDSHLPYGVMGPGWALNGLSAISRCNRTYAQDGTPAPIALTMADAFCLDGNRLRLTSSETLSTYGEAGTTYQTEIANFSNVIANGVAGNGPSYFTVQGKDGLTYEYGNTTDSKILATGNTTPYVWALDKVTDRAGNQMTFTYYQVDGAYVPLSIQYTAPSGSTTFPYQVKFAYTTKSATDTISKFIADTQIQQTEQLSTITVTSSGTAVREYKLLYTTSATTLRAALTSIQECGGSAGTDCLSPTNIGYQSGTAGVARPATATGSGATNGTVYSVDVDGDGKQDLVFATTNSSGNYQWWVQLATASGYGAPINTGAVTVGTTDFLLDDFDAAGGTEILAPVGGVWYAYKLNLQGTSFSATSTGIAVVPNAIYASADTDADGRPDLVYILPTAIVGTASLGIQLNTSSGNGSPISFATSAVVQTLPVINCCAGDTRLYGNNQLPNSSLKHFYYEGNDRQDLILYYYTTSGMNPHYAMVPILPRSTGTPAFGFEYGLGATPPPIAVLNWNDDACTDVLLPGVVSLSPCNGSLPVSVALPASASLALDWDGDGRTDVLADVGGIWQLYRSEGNTVAPAVSTGIPVGTGTWIVTDQNGDGLDDLVFANSSSSNAIYYGLHNGAGQPPDFASSFVDGYGNSATPIYVSIAQSNYTMGRNDVFPYRDYIGPLYVVSEAVFSDPSNMPSGTYSQSFNYIDMWTNLQGRGLQAFANKDTADSRYTPTNTPTHFEQYAQTFPYAGMKVYESITETSSGPLNSSFGTTAEIILDGTANNQRYFPYFSHWLTEVFNTTGSIFPLDPFTHASKSLTYDNYGNATNVSTTVTDSDSGSPYVNDTWTSTTTYTFAPDVSTWCLGLPTETTVTNSSTAPGGAAITRTLSYTPDYSNCRETGKVTEPSSLTYKVTEAYTFDGFGNLSTDTVTGVGMTPRVTTLTWGATGQFLTTVKNPLSQIITLDHDPNTGMLTSQTDPNYTTANPLSTTWQYDDFQRKVLETRPDATSTTWSYNNCVTAGCVNANNKMTVTQTAQNVGGTTQSIQNLYLDSLDRALVTSRTMLSGAYDRNEVQYDSLGRIHLQGAPCAFVSCATYWTTNTYDNLNRLIESQRPISATNSTLQTTTIAYAGLTTTVTDALNNVTVKYSLPSGLLGRSQDAKGYYQNFTYDAFGSLLSLTDSASPSNTLFAATYQYGLQAFKISSKDADLGTSLYTVDPLGEVTAYSDAKSQNFSTTYDALSRPLVRTEPDVTTTWTWGNSAASYNIGKLQSVTAASSAGSYVESYAYDSKTRLSAKNITIPGDASYAYAYAYNPTTGFRAH